MLQVMEDVIAGKTPYADFQGKIFAINKRAGDFASGVEFDFETMFQLQRTEIERLLEAGDLDVATKAIEGYTITCFLIGQ